MDIPSLRVSLANGHEGAFAEFYDSVGEQMLHVAYAILGQREDAEDIVQEVFVSLVRSRRALASVKDLKSYVFASLRRACGRCFVARKRGRKALETIAQDVRDGQAACTEQKDVRLEQALASLPHEQREVIVLKIDGGLTFAEIAAVTSISPNTAASRYRIALEKLRDRMEAGR